MLNKASLSRLEGVHPHLVAVIKRADEIASAEAGFAFQVTEGVRTPGRQRALKAAGASTTLNSRHIPAPNGFAHAVDLAVYISGRLSWEVPVYSHLADIVKGAAAQFGTPIEWGGDWKSIHDGPHFQLPWAVYPGSASIEDAPAAPLPRDLQTLVIGAAGAAVIELQTALNVCGDASLVVDGHFGPRTLAAVRAAQARKRLKVTGVADAALRRAIGLPVA